ncbi:hypothetical protein OSTOST_20178, partial [Ostertagia ostertagi]
MPQEELLQAYTVLMPIMDPDMKDTGLRSTKNVIVVPPDNRTAAMFVQKARFARKLWSMDPSAFGMIEGFRAIKQGVFWKIEFKQVANPTQAWMQIARIFTWQCEKVLNDVEVMDTLRKMQFDVGIAEAFDMCG